MMHTLFNGVFDRRQRRDDSLHPHQHFSHHLPRFATHSRVRNVIRLLVHGNIKVDTHQHLFALELEVGDGEFRGEGHVVCEVSDGSSDEENGDDDEEGGKAHCSCQPGREGRKECHGVSR